MRNKTLNQVIKDTLKIHYPSKNIVVRVWQAKLNWRDITIKIYETPDGTAVVKSYILPVLTDLFGDWFSLNVETTSNKKPVNEGKKAFWSAKGYRVVGKIRI